MSEREALLDDLSAKVLAHMDLAGSIADIRVQVATTNATLAELKADTAALVGQVPDLKTRVERMENNWKWVLAIVGAAWAVILAFVGAYAYKVINGGQP